MFIFGRDVDISVQLLIMSIVSRNDYIVTRFHAEYPQLRSYDYFELMKVVSMSNELKDFYALVKKEHYNICVAPEWFKNGGGSPTVWIEHYSSIMMDLTKLKKESAVKIDIISKKYNSEILSVMNDTKAKVKGLMIDPIMEISELRHEDLPIKVLQASLSKSDVSTGGEPSDKKQFLDDALNNLKSDLVSSYMKDKANFNLRERIKTLY